MKNSTDVFLFTIGAAVVFAGVVLLGRIFILGRFFI